MPVNDIHQITISGLLHGQVVQNVLHYRLTATTETNVASEVANILARFETVAMGAYLACCSDEYTMTSMHSSKIWPAPTSLPVTSATAVGGGTVAIGALPSSVAAVFTKRTAHAGQRFRGRMYMPAVPLTFESNSSVAAGAIGPYNALALILAAELDNGGGERAIPVIYHRDNHLSDPVLSFTIRPVLRNQRRRQIGRGV